MAKRILLCLLFFLSFLGSNWADSDAPKRFVAFVSEISTDIVPVNLAPTPPIAGLFNPITTEGPITALACTHDGKRAILLSGFLGDEQVFLIDLTKNPIVQGDPIIGPTWLWPYAVAITPDDRFAYISNHDIEHGSVVCLDLTTNPPSLHLTIPNLDDPFGLALGPDGSLYVTVFPNQVKRFSPEGTLLATIPVAGGASNIIISPDGSTGYVTNDSGGTITPIALSTNTPGTAFSAGPQPDDIVFTPDGTKGYIRNHELAGGITPFTVATHSLGTFIPIGIYPESIAISPDGKKVYVTDTAQTGVEPTFFPIDVATDTLETPIQAGDVTACIAMDPIEAPLAVFTSHIASKGFASSFDASGSLAPEGAITSYVWDFGDGATETTSAPTIDHTYTAAGTFTVNLYVVAELGPASWMASEQITVPDSSAPVAAFTFSAKGSGYPTSFDATSSHSPQWPIVRYLWNWGDGKSSSLSSPQASHTYASRGTFSVQLTVFDSQGTPSDPVARTITIRPGTIHAPSHFRGKFRKHPHTHKYPFSLHTSWHRSSSSGISRYELFRHHKQIASISTNRHPKYAFFPHPHVSKKRDITSHYLKHLHKAYKIRAVNEFGLASPFVHLRAKK